MRPITRLARLGVLIFGLSRGWQALQEWRIRRDARAQDEADLLAARDLDAELVGQRADERTAKRERVKGG